jgi:hypothetical protein
MAKKKSTPLTLHGLLVALSYWGTATRLLLATFVSVFGFLLGLSETNGTASALGGETIVLIYALGSLLLLDAGYVIAARALPVRRALDVMSLLVADLAILCFYIVPKITVTTVAAPVNPVGVVLLFAVLVLALRLLVGFLFSTKRKA